VVKSSFVLFIIFVILSGILALLAVVNVVVGDFTGGVIVLESLPLHRPTVVQAISAGAVAAR